MNVLKCNCSNRFSNRTSLNCNCSNRFSNRESLNCNCSNRFSNRESLKNQYGGNNKMNKYKIMVDH